VTFPLTCTNHSSLLSTQCNRTLRVLNSYPFSKLYCHSENPSPAIHFVFLDNKILSTAFPQLTSFSHYFKEIACPLASDSPIPKLMAAWNYKSSIAVAAHLCHFLSTKIKAPTMLQLSITERRGHLSQCFPSVSNHLYWKSFVRCGKE